MKEWKSAVADVDQARERFYIAARESLAVDSGSMAQSSFIQVHFRAIASGANDSSMGDEFEPRPGGSSDK